jgi:uncharacterized protein (UPF0548 family)
MSIHALHFDDADEQLAQVRAPLLTELSTGIKAFERAADALRDWDMVYDIEFAHGRDGRDVAAFIDDSIRSGRAAYAVVHAIIDKETP